MNKNEIVSTAARLQLKLNAKELLIAITLTVQYPTDFVNSGIGYYLLDQIKENTATMEKLIKSISLPPSKKKKLLTALTSCSMTEIVNCLRSCDYNFTYGSEIQKLSAKVSEAEGKKRITNLAMDLLESTFPNERHHAAMILQNI